SAAEFRLLKVFLDHPNRVLNRDQLLNLTRGRDADPSDRSMDLQVSRLRQKLREDARAPQLIQTVRSASYLPATAVPTGQPPRLRRCRPDANATMSSRAPCARASARITRWWLHAARRPTARRWRTDAMRPAMIRRVMSCSSSSRTAHPCSSY